MNLPDSNDPNATQLFDSPFDNESGAQTEEGLRPINTLPEQDSIHDEQNIKEDLLVSANKGAVSANKGAVSANKGAVSLGKGAVSANKGAVSANKGAVSANKGAISLGKGAMALPNPPHLTRTISDTIRAAKADAKKTQEDELAALPQRITMQGSERDHSRSRRIPTEQRAMARASVKSGHGVRNLRPIPTAPQAETQENTVIAPRILQIPIEVHSQQPTAVADSGEDHANEDEFDEDTLEFKVSTEGEVIVSNASHEGAHNESNEEHEQASIKSNALLQAMPSLASASGPSQAAATQPKEKSLGFLNHPITSIHEIAAHAQDSDEVKTAEGKVTLSKTAHISAPRFDDLSNSGGLLDAFSEESSVKISSAAASLADALDLAESEEALDKNLDEVAALCVAQKQNAVLNATASSATNAQEENPLAAELENADSEIDAILAEEALLSSAAGVFETSRAFPAAKAHTQNHRKIQTAQKAEPKAAPSMVSVEEASFRDSAPAKKPVTAQKKNEPSAFSSADDEVLGKLVIDAPIDAIVFLDGNDIGTGQVTLKNLDRFSTFEVRVHRAGYFPWTASVSLGGKEAARVTPDLQRKNRS